LDIMAPESASEATEASTSPDEGAMPVLPRMET